MSCFSCFDGLVAEKKVSKDEHDPTAAMLAEQQAERGRVKYGEPIGKLLPVPIFEPMRKLVEPYPQKVFKEPSHWEASDRVVLHLPMAATNAAVAVEFVLNGKQVTLYQGQVDPSITLHDLLNKYSRLTGTKKACAQGGCGSCTVAVAKWNEVTASAHYSSANACLLPVGTLHGVSITTTEGLGCCKSGLHPVQKRVADYNGSQCGYCSPGMVMAMYSKLKSLEPSLPTEQDMQLTIDGNICRCTGYMPLLNALKSFGEGGVEATKNLCYSEEAAPYVPSQHDPNFPQSLATAAHRSSTKMSWNGKEWYRPGSLKEAIGLVQAGAQIVSGNTGLKGLYPDDQAKTSIFVDVSCVAELQTVHVEGEDLVLGAAISIETLGALVSMDERGRHASLSPAIQKLRSLPSTARVNLARMAQHIYNIAGVHVRNRATLGGNMALSKLKPEHFPSDLAPQFLVLGASLNVLHAPTGRSSSKLLADWLKSEVCPDELIVSLRIPICNSVFLTQRTMLRPQNCHAYLNAALCASISAGRLQGVRIAVGALPQAMLATQTSAQLEGKNIQDLQKLLPQLTATLRNEVQFTDHHDLQYRETLLNTFMYKFLKSLSEGGSDTYTSLSRPLPTSNDVSFVNDVNGASVAQAMPKHTSGAQASGEIKYAGDMDMPAGGLHAFMVTSPVAHGMLKGVDASAALKMDGVVAYLDHKDIPGDNNVSNDDLAEPLFCTSRVTYLGQPLGLVVAETSWQAEAAAKAVKVNMEALPAVMTIEKAMEIKQFVKKDGTPCTESQPGKSANVLETDTPSTVRISGSWQSGQCKHFYMERQVAMATPRANEFGGGDGVDLCHATQQPSAAQASVALVLGVPNAWVQIKNQMVGGAFGGKASRNKPTACAAALAAVRLHRPVKLVQDICTDMSMNGGRHPVLVQYDARVDKSSGKILAAKLETFGGRAFIAEQMAGAVAGAHKPCLDPWGNYLAPQHTITEAKMCLLNIPPSTAVRGPSHPKQAMAVETMLQHAAAATRLPLLEVQKNNLDQKLDSGLQPQLWTELEKTADFHSRMREVQAFNQANKLKKRGMAFAPCKWEVPPIPCTATVTIYSGGGNAAPDGSICITIGSSEIGQGLHTKVAQICQLELSKHPLLCEPVPLHLIRVVGNNTEVISGWDMTGGSGTNPQAMRAVAGACEILVERLKKKFTMNPLKKRLMSMQMQALGKTDKLTWQELIQTVTIPIMAMSGADLTARNTVFFGLSNNSSIISQMLKGKMTAPHLGWGAAVTEVEVDVLTGEHAILRSDLLYHQPRSVNPVIDLGQIQGAFVQGLGFFLKEDTIYSEDGSSFITKDTWEYKPPCVKDIPQQFNVAYFRPGSVAGLVYGAKGVGEPPLFMAVSAVNALRACIIAAREDAGLDPWADVSLPLTPARVSTACAVDVLKLCQ